MSFHAKTIGHGTSKQQRAYDIVATVDAMSPAVDVSGMRIMSCLPAGKEATKIALKPPALKNPMLG